MYVRAWGRAYDPVWGDGGGRVVPTQGAGRGRVGRHRRRCGRAPIGGGGGMGVGVGAGTRGSSTFVLEKVYKKARDYAGNCL
jgi:hypothetical protein